MNDSFWNRLILPKPAREAIKQVSRAIDEVREAQRKADDRKEAAESADATNVARLRSNDYRYRR